MSIKEALAPIRVRRTAATELGEWEVRGKDVVIYAPSGFGTYRVVAWVDHAEYSAPIAHAPADIARLIKAVDAMTALHKEGAGMSRLTLVHSRHDLPPFWDGVPVTWAPWSDHRSTLTLHVPADQMACDKCGAVDESLISWGTRPAPKGETITINQTKKTRSGRKYAVAAEVPSWPIADIYAARCRHCGQDFVTDTRTDERWDLDESDYTPQGSYPADSLW